jgi:hypothetical protein
MDTTESELPVPWLPVARGTESDSAHVGRHHFMCSESLELELVAVAVAVVRVVEGAYTQQGRAHIRRIHPDWAARYEPTGMSRARSSGTCTQKNKKLQSTTPEGRGGGETPPPNNPGAFLEEIGRSRRRVGASLAAGGGSARPAGRGGAGRGGVGRLLKKKESTGRPGPIGMGNLPSSIANSTSLTQRTLGFKKQGPQHVTSPVP